MTDPILTHGWTALPRDVSVLLDGKKNIREPEPMTVESILLPETALVKEVLEYARKELSEETFNHSMRVYFYGRAIQLQQFPSWHLSSETYLLTCLLHDIGTSPQNLTSTRLSFEFYGAFLAHTLLTTAPLSCPLPQAEAVTEAIIRHQDIGTTGKITTLGQLIQLATIFDNMGENSKMVHRGTIENVVGAWPRKGWSGCFAATIRRENGLKPWAHTTSLGEEAFPEGVEGNELMKPYDE